MRATLLGSFFRIGHFCEPPGIQIGYQGGLHEAELITQFLIGGFLP
jgi:hypothetical protein